MVQCEIMEGVGVMQNGSETVKHIRILSFVVVIVVLKPHSNK